MSVHIFGASEKKSAKRKSGTKKKHKNEKKGRRILFRGIVILIFAAGLGVLFYPAVSDLWNRWRNEQLINGYEENLSALTADETGEILREAQAYNRQHTYNTIADVFDEEDEYILTHPYDTLLNPSGNNVMGYIEIPKIHQKLAIYHGTGTEALENGVGHVEGTSLPVGCESFNNETGEIEQDGDSSHSVLAGHRGLPSAKLFTDLDQMEAGDVFYLVILDQTYAYEVDKISVVEPDQTEALAIERNQDLCTLLTCTPYGVNTQRLLVRGHRIPWQEEEREDVSVMHQITEKRTLILLAAGIAAVILIGIGIRRRQKKRETKG